MAPTSQVCMLCPSWSGCELSNLLRELRRDCEADVTVAEVAAGATVRVEIGMLCAVRSGVVKEMWMQGVHRGRVVDFGFPGHLIGLEASLGFGNPQKMYAAVQEASICQARCITQGARPESGISDARLSSELARRIGPVYALSWMIQADASTRVAHYIAKASEAQAASSGTVRRPLPNIPRPDIADYLGLRPESVSRVLSQFRASGWIRGKIDRIEVMDLDAIRAVGKRTG